MKRELTTVANVRITWITQGEYELKKPDSREKAREDLARAIKMQCGADHVEILEDQLFIRDMEDKNDD